MRVLAALFTLLLVCCAPPFAQAQKVEPPTEEQRLEVLGLLREIYRSDYVAATSPSLKSELAEKILQTANQTANSAERYAMMRLAADIAVLAGDADLMTEVIDSMAAKYILDEAALRLSALKETLKNLNADTEEAGLEAVLAFSERAIAKNQYDELMSLLTIATTSFRDASARRSIEQMMSRVETLRSQFDKVSTYIDVLREDPDNSEANLVVGKYRCFGRGEWAVGLQHLSRSQDERLRQIALWELSDETDGAQDLKIADGWWEYGGATSDDVSITAKLRAAAYYQRAANSLQGLQKAKALARYREAGALGTIPSLDNVTNTNPGEPEMGETGSLAQRKVVYDLPAGYTDVVVGGSGKYLIFKLDPIKKLAFFDVFAKEVTKYIDIETSDICFTAGAKEFFIAKRPQNTVERWSLETFTRSSIVKLPLEHPVQALVMGSASTGPLYVGAQNGPGVFLNPRSLRPVSLNVVDHQYQRPGKIQGAGPESRVRASANGRAFAMWRTNVSPGGFRTYVIADRMVHTYYQHDTMGYIEPSPDGELMYTSRGVYTNQTREYLANKGNAATSFRIPAVTGNYAVGVPRNDDRNKKQTNPVHILVSGEADPILTLPEISIRPGEYSDFHGREILTLARRVYLLPEAGLLITLPESNKSLIMHRVILEEELEKSGVDYLYVASRPPPVVAPGGTYKYQIDAKSKNGNISFELISGPNAMRVSPQGLLTWRVPRNTRGDQEVIVSIRGANGQQRTHTFRIGIQ